MFSRVLRRVSPAKSLYVAVFLAMLSTLTLSFLIFRQISLHLEQMWFAPVYDRLDQLQLEESIRTLHAKGTADLQSYLSGLDHVSNAHHYLLDATGRDVLTGTNRASLLPPPPALKWRIRTGGHSVAAQRSVDGQYWFAALGGPSKPWIWTYLPYYLLVVGATGLLCWLASIAVVAPIRNIAASIACFGRGDLSARVRSRRLDEIGALGNSFDEMAERLQRMIETERRLLADVSHELRSPLARLKFAVRLARTSTDAEAALDRIDLDVDRITFLVADILEVASSEGELEGRAPERVQFGDLLDEVTRDCAFEAEMHPCRLELDAHSDIEVHGSRELLRRAVENVMRNAIRYSPNGGTVMISAKAGLTDVVLTIQDQGPGVPEDLLPRIFDPFYRVDESRDASRGGSGLGLSIARRALAFHKGTISARNAAPGLSVEIAIPRVSKSERR